MKYLMIFILAVSSFMAYEFYVTVSRPARMIRRMREERLKDPQLNWPENSK